MPTRLLPEADEYSPEGQALLCTCVPSHHCSSKYASLHADTHLCTGSNAHAIRLVLCLRHLCPRPWQSCSPSGVAPFPSRDPLRFLLLPPSFSRLVRWGRAWEYGNATAASVAFLSLVRSLTRFVFNVVLPSPAHSCDDAAHPRASSSTSGCQAHLSLSLSRALRLCARAPQIQSCSAWSFSLSARFLLCACGRPRASIPGGKETKERKGFA